VEAKPPSNPYAPPRAEDVSGLGPDGGGIALTDAEIDAFVGKNADYYRYHWRNAEARGGWYIGFNWPAAIVSLFWLLHRRLYREFAILLGIELVVPRVLQVIMPFELRRRFLPGGVMVLLLTVGMGFIANRLYLWRAHKIVGQVRGEPEEGRYELLVNRGGTSPAALGVGIAAWLVLRGLMRW
jgi:hypothetical protein